ncbi:helix-turn-helix transcriptional regulator [Vibrio maerlii]|uniref:helix-turn-helix transcriptional regulator n=1 Tax=Vibrio maerlii TaxID=2231648 RepID=UPI000E3E7836|nr:LuxR C-terminal-related transcriptional regulator [Vibrio maerlii]
MDASVESKQADNKLGLSFTFFEKELRENLESIGIVNVGLIIYTDINKPVLKTLEPISVSLNFCSEVESNLTIYLKKSVQHERKVIHHDIDYLIDQTLLSQTNLTITEPSPNLYMVTDKINYNFNLTILLHSFTLLGQYEYSKLRLISDIAIAWANSWVSHQKLLNAWEHLSYTNRKPGFPVLTASESEVFHHILRGWTCSEIANIRQVSKETVRSQIKSILHKSQCNNQNQLLARYGHSQWFSSSPFGVI